MQRPVEKTMLTLIGIPFILTPNISKFALNLKIPFHSPEEYFLGDPPAQYLLGAFNPQDYIPASLPIIPTITSSPTPDVIIFVGSPAAGKSTFFRDVLLPMGYTRVNQDALKTRDKCLSEAATLLTNNVPIVIGALFPLYRTNKTIRMLKYQQGSYGLSWLKVLAVIYAAFILLHRLNLQDIITSFVRWED